MRKNRTRFFCSTQIVRKPCRRGNLLSILSCLRFVVGEWRGAEGGGVGNRVGGGGGETAARRVAGDEGWLAGSVVKSVINKKTNKRKKYVPTVPSCFNVPPGRPFPFGGSDVSPFTCTHFKFDSHKSIPNFWVSKNATPLTFIDFVF